MKPFLFTILIISSIGLSSKAQDKLGIGVVGVYNTAISNPGFGFRLLMPVNKVLSVSPIVNYNQGVIEEMNAGVQVQYFLVSNSFQKGYGRYENKRFNPSLYVLAALNYNKWINYFPSLSTRAKANNFLPLPGVGFSFGGKGLRLISEAKVNPIWKESMVEVGLMAYPFNGGGRKSNQLRCPSFK